MMLPFRTLVHVCVEIGMTVRIIIHSIPVIKLYWTKLQFLVVLTFTRYVDLCNWSRIFLMDLLRGTILPKSGVFLDMVFFLYLGPNKPKQVFNIFLTSYRTPWEVGTIILVTG